MQTHGSAGSQEDKVNAPPEIYAALHPERACRSLGSGLQKSAEGYRHFPVHENRRCGGATSFGPWFRSHAVCALSIS